MLICAISEFAVKPRRGSLSSSRWYRKCSSFSVPFRYLDQRQMLVLSMWNAILIPFSPQTSSEQLPGWLWRPQHIAPAIILHPSVLGMISPLLTIHGQHHTCDLHLHLDLVWQLLKEVQARQSWLSQVLCHL